MLGLGNAAETLGRVKRKGVTAGRDRHKFESNLGDVAQTVVASAKSAAYGCGGPGPGKG